MVRIERYDDVAAFFRRAEPFLLAREAEHCLQLGFRTTLEQNSHAYGDADPLLLVAADGDIIVAVATCTPPFNLVLSQVDDPTVVDVLADVLRASGAELPGVMGPIEAGAAFATLWGPNQIELEERIYRASEVIAPRPVGGAMRDYEERDRPLVLEWVDAFYAEAMPGSVEADAEQYLARQLGSPERGLVLWDDGGRPVSLAGFAAPTPNGIRVGPVYTPPELRGRGYASAVTAGLTDRLLAGGRQFCFLFTNLANPTSNSIYQQVGYRPVTDVSVWRFDPA